jgi:hypothetical protein
MPWTAAQKREARAQKRKQDATNEREMGKKMLELSPPNSEIKKPYNSKHLGNNKVDYGGHQKALNFPLQETPPIGETQLALQGEGSAMHNNTSDLPVLKMGSMTIGLAYEGDWKAKSKLAGKGERKMCVKSEQYLDFLLHVKEALHPKVHSSLQLLMDDSMRVNILYGAKTLAHTDSYRGNTPNFLYIVGKQSQEPGWLCYDTFPRFKVSIVKIKGGYYIPHSYSQINDEVRCIGENPNKPGKPIFFIFKSNVIDAMEPFGNLPYGIVGWKANGDLQVVPEFEGVCLYTTPLIFQTYKWKDVIKHASEHPVKKKPRKRIVSMHKTDTWLEFRAYIHRHWWCGNHLVERYHVFFRTIREVPISSNVIRNGPRANYIFIPNLDSLDSHLKKLETSQKFTDIN